MRIQSFREKSIMMRSESGSIGIVVLVIAALLIWLLPIQVTMLKFLTEKLYIWRAEDLIGASIINSVKHLDSEDFGCGVLSFEMPEAEEELFEDIRSKLDKYPVLKTEGDPVVEIRIIENTIIITGEVSIYSMSGRVEKIHVENTFTFDIP